MNSLGDLKARIAARDAHVAVIGLGYVGLPLALAAHGCGFRVTGFDTDPAKIANLAAGTSYINYIDAAAVSELAASPRFHGTSRVSDLDAADIIVICVPTPLDRHREPDMRHVVDTSHSIASILAPGRLVVLESTTWPGTTDELVRPILEGNGLVSGVDFLLAYSPERDDPGNTTHRLGTVPKIVGGDHDLARATAAVFYESFIPAGTIVVPDTRTAEAVKLTENIFRSVNIALVNELKVIFDAMGINIWDVIEAASTKPFGYMPFWPGPGLGGHCIPIDPFYLAWKAREFGVPARFIELAGEINTLMPHHIVSRLAGEIDHRFGRGLSGAAILIVGMAYKKNVDDCRESPGLTLMTLLESRGAAVSFFDPFIGTIPATRAHAGLAGRRSLAWNDVTDGVHDAALIVTDHDCVDYDALVAAVPLLVDTRNATRAVRHHRERIVLA
ncbi:MAG: nucleotide sugar dehydrogenase [Alphaproteobacteria bacterium]|nr:nucleotide sugar dehydrogenase [Alphaproteobacteria bacterium]